MINISDNETKPKTIQGLTGTWELVIGMEVHAQVLSKSKLFSGSSTLFGAEPNLNVSFVDAAMLACYLFLTSSAWNRQSKQLGLRAKINLISKFDRKIISTQTSTRISN